MATKYHADEKVFLIKHLRKVQFPSKRSEEVRLGYDETWGTCGFVFFREPTDIFNCHIAKNRASSEPNWKI
jgi:hypothetical protein